MDPLPGKTPIHALELVYALASSWDVTPCRRPSVPRSGSWNATRHRCFHPPHLILGRDFALRPIVHRSGMRLDVTVPPHLVLGN